jgi:hypothetical protein
MIFVGTVFEDESKILGWKSSMDGWSHEVHRWYPDGVPIHWRQE